MTDAGSTSDPTGVERNGMCFQEGNGVLRAARYTPTMSAIWSESAYAIA